MVEGEAEGEGRQPDGEKETKSPHLRESMKVLDSGSQPLDSEFQISGFWNPCHSGFRIPYHRGFRIPNHCRFRIPVLWIPDSNSKNLLDSGFSYMGRDKGTNSVTLLFEGLLGS